MLRIIPNKNNIGAEIETDLQKLSKENFKIIMNALNKYGMFFFRRQNLSSKHYVEFAKNFGKLADYPRLKGLNKNTIIKSCLLYTSPSPRDKRQSRMPSSA